MAGVRRIGRVEVVAHFHEWQDPRSTIDQRHPPAGVAVIAPLAALAGAGGPTAIARRAALQRQSLTQVIDLPHGIPGKGVFRRVLMARKPAAFRARFAGWLHTPRDEAIARTGADRPAPPVDGKTARRSHDRHNGPGALRPVSVWAGEDGLSLGQVACDAKSNEITAIPELLRQVDIRGAIATIDAMGARKGIAGQVIDGGGDSVPTSEGDHEALYRAVAEHIAERSEGDLSGARGHVATETGHGREEARTQLHLPAPAELPGFGRWTGLKSIGMPTPRCRRDGEEAIEARSHLSGPGPDVREFARAVRGHRGIENGCHRALEMTFREDESRLRERHLRENFAWLNRIALSLPKQHPGRQSVAMKRRGCGRSDAFLMEVITGSIC